MIDKLVDMVTKMTTNSQQGAPSEYYNKTTIDEKKVKYCFALAKCGWRTKKTRKIHTHLTDQKYPQKECIFVITWEKEGKEDIEISLSFAEQRLWIAYMINDEQNK